MKTSEPIEASTVTSKQRRQNGDAEPQEVVDDASGELSDGAVALRGTRRSQSSTPRRQSLFRGTVRIPEPRRDGAAPYVRQLMATCAPLLLADLLTLVLVVVSCSWLGLQWLDSGNAGSTFAEWFLPVALAWILINAVLGLYPGVCLGLVDEIKRLSLSLTIVALIAAAAARLHGAPVSDRAAFLQGRLAFLAAAYVLSILVAPFLRSTVRKLFAKTKWWGYPTIVCGNDAAAFNVDQWLLDNQRLGLRPLGVIADPDVLELDRQSSRFIGCWEDARRLAEQHHAYWGVMVESGDSEDDNRQVASVVESCLGNIPHVYVVSRLTGIPDHWNRHQMDEGLSGLLIEQHLLLPIPQLVKRGMDLIVATLASFILIPLFVVLAIAVKITSRGPVFFGHERIGKGNTRFRAWKFRTMISNADEALDEYLAQHPDLRAEWEETQKLRNDPRVTKIGKWMRKWSVDELPQIWNVLRGEMSIVGPRPIGEVEIVRYGEHFELLVTVAPGMTGLWQVCGRNDTTYDERVQLDMYYIHHWSPWMDLYLLGRTIKPVLLMKGAY